MGKRKVFIKSIDSEVKSVMEMRYMVNLMLAIIGFKNVEGKLYRYRNIYRINKMVRDDSRYASDGYRKICTTGNIEEYIER